MQKQHFINSVGANDSFLWLSSRMATFSTFAGSNPSFTRAVGLLKATYFFIRCLASVYPFQFRAFHYVRASLLCESCRYVQCQEGLYVL